VDAPNPSEYMQALAQGQNPLIATDEASFEYRMDFVMEKAPPFPWPLRPALMRKTLARVDINRAIFDDMLATRERLEQSGFEQQLSDKISMPTLIIWGAQDRVLDVSAVEVFKQFIPMPRCRFTMASATCRWWKFQNKPLAVITALSVRLNNSLCQSGSNHSLY